MPLNNNILRISHDKCTGCRACADICAKNCITFQRDGIFLYPEIQESNCTNCGRCLSVCPAESVAVNNNDNINDESSYYYAWSTDDKIRLTSTSGGVGSSLARHAIERGFYVCGATLEDGVVHHIVSNEDNVINKIKGSKYVESNLQGIYQKVFALLNNGERVFFIGTPCSVSALIKYVPSRLQNNLLTCEILCHGVNSSIVWKDFLENIQERYNSRIVSYNFRSKSKGWGELRVSGEFENGRSFDVPAWKNQFHVWFGKHYILRRSCLNCQYRRKNRQADLIIGDFWGIEKLRPDILSKKGVSLLIIRTSRGGEFVDNCKYIRKGSVDANRAASVLKGFVERRSSDIRNAELENSRIFEEKYSRIGYKAMTKYYPCPSAISRIRDFVISRINKIRK